LFRDVRPERNIYWELGLLLTKSRKLSPARYVNQNSYKYGVLRVKVVFWFVQSWYLGVVAQSI
jgi:hypothetical protein